VGHLFQNRYKSIVVEEEAYLLELVRYLHLNPVRAKRVPDLRALDRYPWTGHSALMGAVPRPWQETATILARFGGTVARARRGYRAFVAAGLRTGQRPDLQGGGLIRSLGGWETVKALRRGREAYAGDERVLGSAEFVEHLRREVEARDPRRPTAMAIETVVDRVCAVAGVTPERLRGGGRHPAVVRAREGIAYLWTEVLGGSGRALASLLGVHPAAVYKAAGRGAGQARAWQEILAR
jgi:hypothetical protein